MDEDRREARVRFDEELAKRGEDSLTAKQLEWVEDKYGPIEELDTRDFRDAVGDVVDMRRYAPAFLSNARRARGDAARTTRPAPDSPLASEPWHDYTSAHLDRVLGSFFWLRDGTRLMLGLRPLSPGAPATNRAAMAWHTGDERFLTDGSDDRELRQLRDREEALWWLAAYIARQNDSGGYEVLMVRGLMGEDRPLPFPASCHELTNLRDLARRVAAATGCRECETTEWLLADLRPELPSVLLVTAYPSLVEVARGVDGEPAFLPHVSRRYVITVGSGLVSPDEVAALYRRARNRDYDLPTDPSARQTVWSSELVRFVAYERQRQAEKRSVTWAALLERWNAVHPQHPYANERAMRSSYRQAGARPKGREPEKGAEP